jgi:hypothetical protein
MKRLYLRDVEANAHASTGYAELIRSLRSTGVRARNPARVRLQAASDRAPGALLAGGHAGGLSMEPGFRERIAAFTSKLNHGLF